MPPTPKVSVASLAGLVWAGAWRAEGAHLVFFALIPLAVGLGEAAIKIVFLPFLRLRFGDRNIELTTAIDHLANPGCWVVLARCEVADTALVRLRRHPARGQAPVNPTAADDDLPPVELPEFLTWRHLWFAAWLGWYLVYLVRRERAARPPKT